MNEAQYFSSPNLDQRELSIDHISTETVSFVETIVHVYIYTVAHREEEK